MHKIRKDSFFVACVISIAIAAAAAEAKSRKKAEDVPTPEVAVDGDRAWQDAYNETSKLWAKVVDANPELASGQQFFRTFVAKVRATGKIKNFGQVFEGLVGRSSEATACSPFLLCDEHSVPKFQLTNPIAITDILRYTFNATCFGYVQDGNHRIALLYLTEVVVGMIDQAELARSFKSVDQAYLRIDFANMLATAVSLTKQKHHKTFENLRRLEHNADETAAKKGAKGQSRPPTQIEADAAAKACQGH